MGTCQETCNIVGLWVAATARTQSRIGCTSTPVTYPVTSPSSHGNPTAAFHGVARPA